MDRGGEEHPRQQKPGSAKGRGIISSPLLSKMNFKMGINIIKISFVFQNSTIWSLAMMPIHAVSCYKDKCFKGGDIFVKIGNSLTSCLGQGCQGQR